MYVNQNVTNEAGGFAPSSNISNGGGISGGFLKVLHNQMEEWIKTLKDNEITRGELSHIDSMASGSSVSQATLGEEQGETVYEGSAAYLYASTKINDINNLVSWIFSFISKENELYDKASNMLTS